MTTKEVSRTEARERALQYLYSLHYAKLETEEDLFDALLTFLDETRFSKEYIIKDSFLWEIVLGVWQHSEEIDTKIEEFSQDWKIERIAKIEISLLRMATYELLYTKTEPKIIISESLRLLKRFGDNNASSFINGILNSIAKNKISGD